MAGVVMLYAGSIVITLWGVAHIVPTKPVVSGFGTLDSDNRRILTMEWVAEGLTLCFIGILVFLTTLLVGSGSGAALVYRSCAGMLLVMAIWTLATGGRTSIVQFKVCPVVKTGVAILFLVGSAV
ncbi:MAG: hypothetical protein OEN01_12740 [Candidatus Krumholzibacteria bacterium]|nr:hypothetical protein [Candidatus Krumholzibacteria bacterium]